MKKLDKNKMQALKGAGLDWCASLTVSGDSFYQDDAGYIFYSDRITNSAGEVLFQGTSGKFHHPDIGESLDISYNQDKQGNVYSLFLHSDQSVSDFD